MIDRAISRTSLACVALVAVTCLASYGLLGTSGCAQSASGWQAQDQASLAADQAGGAEAKSSCSSKCKDGSAGKCCKEGKGDSAGCGTKCAGDKDATADSSKKCCKSGAKGTAQTSAGLSAAK